MRWKGYGHVCQSLRKWALVAGTIVSGQKWKGILIIEPRHDAKTKAQISFPVTVQLLAP